MDQNFHICLRSGPRGLTLFDVCSFDLTTVQLYFLMSFFRAGGVCFEPKTDIIPAGYKKIKDAKGKPIVCDKT